MALNWKNSSTLVRAGVAPNNISHREMHDRLWFGGRPAKVRIVEQPVATAPQSPPPRVPLSDLKIIHLAVANEFGLGEDEIFNPSRKNRYVVPRQVAHYLSRLLLTKRSLPQIGDYYGLDHTTVLHGANKIEAMIADPKNAELAERVARIEAIAREQLASRFGFLTAERAAASEGK